MGENPLGLSGIEFVELAAPNDPAWLGELLLAFGFSKTMRHETRDIDLYEQGEMRFIVNRERGGHASSFARAHGPSICSMGWRFAQATNAAKVAAARGARIVPFAEYAKGSHPVPAIVGIGESLIYMIDDALPVGDRRIYEQLGFVALDRPTRVADKGFLRIDHLTNNVEKGTMAKWAAFYKEVFGFTEVRYFDIRGVKTGLTSYALRSPCGTFCIPINEADEAKSQINEYLDEYKGPGVQHLAFLTTDILSSLRALDGSPIQFLDIDDDYYREVFGRVPNVSEPHDEIQKRQVLVDGDDKGYLLQIFTKNLIGPIFVEIIQRKNHLSFGEGNFTALFRSIERDQAKRGVLD